MIEITKLTKQYRSGKGIFDLSFSVDEGEVFGYLGPNGAGKTTTIRHLLGFMRPDRGRCTINGLDCRRKTARIQEFLGYLPEESAFFKDMTGVQFLGFMEDMRGTRDKRRRAMLLERFELDTAGKIRKMSKGMRQKLALVTAFMHDPAVYVLDEPTGGLDPLMQNVFIDLVLEEKRRGKTILMSSHRFEEIERTSDRAGIIREGRLAAVEDVDSLKSSQRTAYIVTVGSDSDIDTLRSAGLEIGSVSHNRVEVFVTSDFGAFTRALADCEVLGLDVAAQSLEQVFMKYYRKEEEVS
ncbi:MAG: ABC transporter ATP-binding protein [Bacillota bacterium]